MSWEDPNEKKGDYELNPNPSLENPNPESDGSYINDDVDQKTIEELENNDPPDIPPGESK